MVEGGSATEVGKDGSAVCEERACWTSQRRSGDRHRTAHKAYVSLKSERTFVDREKDVAVWAESNARDVLAVLKVERAALVAEGVRSEGEDRGDQFRRTAHFTRSKTETRLPTGESTLLPSGV